MNLWKSLFFDLQSIVGEKCVLLINSTVKSEHCAILSLGIFKIVILNPFNSISKKENTPYALIDYVIAFISQFLL
jgi:hypothetical protein